LSAIRLSYAATFGLAFAPKLWALVENREQALHIGLCKKPPSGKVVTGARQVAFFDEIQQAPPR
jgi:hypothetical protein